MCGLKRRSPKYHVAGRESLSDPNLNRSPPPTMRMLQNQLATEAVSLFLLELLRGIISRISSIVLLDTPPWPMIT